MSWLARIFGRKAAPAPSEATPPPEPPPQPVGHHRLLSEWLAERGRADEAALIPLLLDIAAACDTAEAAGALTPEAAKTLSEGLGHPAMLVWSNTIDMVRSLERFDARVAEIYAPLLRSPSARTRFAALCCVSARTPTALAAELLATGLSDKGADVRWKAASLAQGLGRHDLVPAMEAALAAERSEKARKSIAFSLELLRDGWSIEPIGEDAVSFSVPVRDGITSISVPRAELARKGPAKIAAETRVRQP